MATQSLQQLFHPLVHPIESLSRDVELSLVFELEDIFLMPLDRIVELIGETNDALLRGYLFGVYDMRRSAIYSGSTQ
ncbi:hypothetical protein PQR71_35235 [Paraburkholderia fungorum]|uniref:hypothetical protein n=1 Tax=Paraburkholderia fungorum TaxID=134537 RepID=UPI0038BD05FC